MDKVLFTGQAYRPHLDFWNGHLAAYGEGSLFQAGKQYARGGAYRTKVGALDEIAYTAVTALANENDTAFFVCLAGGLGILLGRYMGSAHVTVHTPLSVSAVPEDIFTDKVPLLLNADGNLTLRDYLNITRETVKDCYKYQHIPPELLGGAFSSNIFVSCEGMHASSMPAGTASAYDLLILFKRQAGGCTITIHYKAGMYDEQLIAQLPVHLGHILSQYVRLTLPIREIALLSPSAQQRLSGNEAAVLPPCDKGLVQLIEEKAAAFPHRVALVWGDHCMSYQELNEQANRLAAYLQSACGLRAGGRVGLLLANREELVIAMLAVLKVGAAYVPVDPLYPASRILFIMEDAGLSLMICNSEYSGQYKQVRIPLLILDECSNELSRYSKENRSDISSRELIAYIIYTSGSTGRPKGVQVTQRSMLNLLRALAEVLPVDADTVYSFTTSPAFDAAVKNIFLPLLTGGTLCLGRELRDIDGLLTDMERYRVTAMHATPSLWTEVLSALAASSRRIYLKCISSGGDRLSGALANKLHTTFQQTIYNLYGPTEGCVNASWYPVSSICGEDPPIGWPLPGYRIYITDQYGHLLPPGVDGEICIAGEGVAAGYLNMEALSKEKFLDSPFAESERLYRTGDTGRWLPDGAIAFRGRRDAQLKLNGYRIEPGEVENQLQTHEGIQDVLVIPDGGMEKLLAFYTGEAALSEQLLRGFLAERLPVYMTPHRLVYLTSFPLTPSGKVDRKRLLELAAISLSDYIPPANEVEEILQAVWASLLGLDRVSVDADFFHSSGNSLKAIKLAYDIEQELGVKIGIRELFSMPTIRQQAAAIARAGYVPGQGAFVSIPLAEKKEYYDTSYGQQRQWILDQQEKEQRIYNMSGVLKLKGSLDAGAVETACAMLTDRHESLRTIFITVEGHLKQRVLPKGAVRSFRMIRLQGEDNPAAQAAAMIRQAEMEIFDLEKGPLFKAYLFDLGNHEYRLYLSFDHIIADGTSMQVLIRDFIAFYNHITLQSEPLAPLRIQYKDVAAFQNRKAVDPSLQDYWRSYLAEDVADLQLPLSRPRPAAKTYRGGSINRILDAAAVNNLCRERGVTPFMFFMSALMTWLYRVSGQAHLTVGTGIAGRTHPDLEQQVGLLANILPLRACVNGRGSFAALLSEMKKNALQCFERQEYPFLKLLEDLQVKWQKNRSPLFDVMLTVQRDYLADLQLRGIVAEEEEWETDTCLFDLYFNIIEQERSFRIVLNYDSTLFSGEEAASMLGSFCNLLAMLTDNPFGLLDAYPLGIAGSINTHCPVAVVDADGHPLMAGMVGTIVVREDERPAVDVERVFIDGLAFACTNDKGRWITAARLEMLDLEPGGYYLDGEYYHAALLEDEIAAAYRADDCIILNQLLNGTRYIVAHISGVAVVESNRYREQIIVNPLNRFPLKPDGSIDKQALSAIPLVPEQDLLEQHIGALADVQHCAIINPYTYPDAPVLFLGDVPGILKRESIAASNADTAIQTNVKQNETGSGQPAWNNGGDLSLPEDTLCQALLRTAREYPDRGIHLVQDNAGNAVCLSYRTLLAEALRVAGGLQAGQIAPGRPVLLQVQQTRYLFPVFWACILSGLRPVIVAIPPAYDEHNNVLDKLFHAWQLLERPYIISDAASQLSSIRQVYPAAAAIQVLELEQLLQHDKEGRVYEAAPAEVVFYQLSSGSTGAPKCIAITHEGVVAHIEGTRLNNGLQESDVTLNWMPFDHVGAILTYHLKDTYMGLNQVQVATSMVLEDPLLWLDCIEKYRVTHTWSPSFGYRLVADAMQKAGHRKWDLSCIRYFMNGGEQVNQHVISDFLSRTQSSGIRPEHIQPAFGMAEVCTAFIYNNEFAKGQSVHYIRKDSLSGALEKANAESIDTATFIELGPPMPGVEIRITDNENKVLPEKRIGRFQIRGKSVTPGYFGNEQANRDAFVGDGWFNSGDLGFMENGKLTLTGREKEMIVVRGSNFYCSEIEDFTGQLPGVLATYVAACPVRNRLNETEEFVLFYVPSEQEEVADIQAAVAARFGISPYYVLPLAKGAFPKTTSGKIQRGQLQAAFEKGSFDSVIREMDLRARHPQTTLPAWFFGRQWYSRQLRPRSCRHEEMDVLIFAMDDSLVLAWKQQYPQSRCIRVKPGYEYREEGQDAFMLHPNRSAEYRQLADVLVSRGIKVDHVVHGWNFTPFEPMPVEAIGAAAEDCFTGLLYVLQLLPSLRKEQMMLHVITSYARHINEGDRIMPAKSLLPGMVLSAGQELNWLKGSCLDLPFEDRILLPEILMQEVNSRSADKERAFRDGNRLVCGLRQLEWPVKESGNPQQIKQEGMYLVAGGLGNIGASLCTHLLERYRITLLITGRTAESELMEPGMGRKAEVLRQLRELSDEVEYAGIGVMDKEQLSLFLDSMERQYNKPLDGIIQLTGEEGDLETHFKDIDRHLVMNLREDAVRAAFQAKVYGTAVLARLVMERAHAILINFSTALTHTGGASSSLYTAVSSFQDGMAFVDPRISTLNWSNWTPDEYAELVRFTEEKGFLPVKVQDGIRSFAVALQAGLPQVYIGLDARNDVVRNSCYECGLGERQLSIYYVPREGAERERLHESIQLLCQEAGLYYQPGLKTALLERESLPLDGAGKVIKKLLYDTKEAYHVTGAAVPQTATERKLYHIWQEVLDNGKISTKVSFFALGGDSLKAVQLIFRINREFGTRLDLKHLFEYPSIQQLAAALQLHVGKVAAIRPVPVQEDYEVSHAQRRLWLSWQKNKKDTTYNIICAYTLKGRLDVQILEKAFAFFIERHEIMRTGIVSVKGVPRQKIRPFRPDAFRLALTDLQGLPDQQEIIAGLAETEAAHCFDLENDTLFRIKLIRTAIREHVLLFTTHHIISDGWSMNILAREVMHCYEAFSAGISPELPVLPIQYKDYAAWQHQLMHSGQMEPHRAYWMKKFEKGVPVLDFPADHERPAARTLYGESVHSMLPGELLERLKLISGRYEVSLFMVMLALTDILVHRYTGQEDFVLKTPVAGRNHPELEDQAGCYINTLILHAVILEEDTFEDLLLRVKQTAMEAFEHQEYPVDMLIEDLQLQWASNRAPFSDVVVLFLNANARLNGNDLDRMDNIQVTEYDTGNRINQFDLRLVFAEGPDSMDLKIDYNRDLYRKETIERMAARLVQLATVLSDKPGKRLTETDLDGDHITLTPFPEQELQRTFSSFGF